MTVFPFPPDADAPFSVVGFDWADGEPAGELFVLPRGMLSVRVRLGRGAHRAVQSA